MATTKIWAVKGRIADLTNYVDNPQKTTGASIQEFNHILHYTTDFEKTDGKTYVSGVNCIPEIAAMEMATVKKQYGKEDGIICFHGYQSFKAGEVTADKAHQVGLELAEVMWGDRFQVVVTTHLNTDCIHNHFAVNSVSFRDGGKYNSCKEATKKLRRESDMLCLSHNLSIIQNPSMNRRSKGAYYAEKKGEITSFEIHRNAIDKAISYSQSMPTFIREMAKLGYEVKDGNYLAIRLFGKEKFTRTYRLGDNYTNEAIRYQINRNWHPQRHLPEKPEYDGRMQFAGNLEKVKKMTGFKALYFHYMYLMGIIPKGKANNEVHPLTREDIRHLDRLIEHMKFLYKNHVNTAGELKVAENKIDGEMQELIGLRTKVKNKLRRAKEPEEINELKTHQADLTVEIIKLRSQLIVANEIETKSEDMRHKIETARIMSRLNNIKDRCYER